MNFLRHFKYLIYPNVCRSCSEILNDSEQIICIKCVYNLPYSYFEKEKENEVFNLFLGRVPIEFATALCLFSSTGTIRDLLHQLKYGGQSEIGIKLGNILGKSLLESEFFTKPDVIIPVPMHPKKLKKRGYNQAEMIAIGVSEILDVPIQTQGLLKILNTKTQTKKSKFDRWLNVEKSFRSSQDVTISNKNILLIDDVVTTGATLEACSSSLYNMGNNKISLATLAFAQ
jgi:ComF family protein